MAVGAHFLAFDLGAESGRAMLGRLRAGVLDVSEIHRFVNEPVRQNGSLHWDVLRIWLELKQGMERAAGTPIESVGVDAWGCDYALVGEQGVLLQNPYHYRDKRTDGVMEAVFERVRPTKFTRSPASSSCRSTRSISSTRHAARRRGSSTRRCVSARFRIS